MSTKYHIPYKKALPFVIIISLLLIFLPNFSYADSSQNPNTQCKNAINIAFPKEDLPTSTEQKSLRGCSSENLYYGIGVPVDYVKARKCAFIEMVFDNQDPMGGVSTLMMIYANGNGVKRNFDMAIKLVCNSLSFLAQNDSDEIISDLTSLKTKPTKSFDLCEDTASEFMLKACAYRDDTIKAAKLKAINNSTSSGWRKNDQAVFKKLQQAGKKYFDDYAATYIANISLVSCEAPDAHSDPQKSFTQYLQKFEKSQLPTYSQKDFQNFDAELNKEYQNLLMNPQLNPKSPNFDQGTITTGGIAATEKSWLAYREAWVTFGAIHYPQTSADSLRAWLDKEHILELKAITNVPSC